MFFPTVRSDFPSTRMMAKKCLKLSSLLCLYISIYTKENNRIYAETFVYLVAYENPILDCIVVPSKISQ